MWFSGGGAKTNPFSQKKREKEMCTQSNRRAKQPVFIASLPSEIFCFAVASQRNMGKTINFWQHTSQMVGRKAARLRDLPAKVPEWRGITHHAALETVCFQIEPRRHAGELQRSCLPLGDVVSLKNKRTRPSILVLFGWETIRLRAGTDVGKLLPERRGLAARTLRSCAVCECVCVSGLFKKQLE